NSTMANRYRKQQFFLSREEDILLGWCMKQTGLDRTTTIRLLMRQGAIELAIRYFQKGGRVTQDMPDLLTFHDMPCDAPAPE
ncbi:MAG TPA: hypothetical protein V6C65_23420, partial [Allocoleopsis sp.]